MLVANPVDRASLDSVLKHPWYVHNLPPYLAKVNKKTPKAATTRQSESDVLQVVSEAQQT